MQRRRDDGRHRGKEAYLVVNALVEEDPQRPPIGPNVVATAGIDFGGKVSQSARFATQDLAGDDVGRDVLSRRLAESVKPGTGPIYKVCQVNVAVGV